MDVLMEMHYGVQLPFLPFTTLLDAQRHAQQQSKYLLVYLHCADHPLTASFIVNVLSSLHMTALFRENVMLFGASVHEESGFDLSAKLECTTFPYTALFLKQQLILDIQGEVVDGATYSLELQKQMEVWHPVTVRESSLKKEREDAQRLREAEENEMNRVMQIDMERLAKFEEREKERKAAELKELADQKEAAEQAERKKSEEERIARELANETQRLKDALELTKAVALSSLPDEPSSSAPADQTANIAVRAFTGKTFERKFWRSDLVADVFNYAKTTEGFDGRKFYLAGGFPPKRIDFVSPTDDDRNSDTGRSGTPRGEGGPTKIADVPALLPRAVLLMREEK